jgi:hypothetical protein
MTPPDDSIRHPSQATLADFAGGAGMFFIIAMS